MPKIWKQAGIVLAVSGAVLAGTATAAQAKSSTCSVNGAYPWLPNSCQTASVGAYSNHTVKISIGAYAGCKFDYKVRDIANNKVVNSGRVATLSKTISGVYSFYRLELTRVGSGCGGSGEIQGV
ncbi:hypothetical protein [Actinoplanes teichomyceticus]|uniref:Secreted protein n=1 Tax=Actinoplanes teichomyceticus TaxID=1867 RepID=A0A561WRG2_ACTTI|nr:hypothetical protein [Actinoplanes teichomyceticus]TWG26457.1 hypothetical protein FHX34_1011441 [Actinoplanes teichomyceticus]GIF11534.1 hypothetical protein Ate01nite_15660 [Actinoplanes teichomyceticus]